LLVALGTLMRLSARGRLRRVDREARQRARQAQAAGKPAA
ncbi:MAG: cytochrome c oxidase assembly protein, partial [Bordetella sp.]|nr:cytochrome c oxidase assembly protein [Bordetella sp.]